MTEVNRGNWLDREQMENLFAGSERDEVLKGCVMLHDAAQREEIQRLTEDQKRIVATVERLANILGGEGPELPKLVDDIVAAEKRLTEERDAARAEAASCVKFLETELGWEDFRAEGFIGQEAVSSSTKNCQTLRAFLTSKGDHGVKVLAELSALRAELEAVKQGKGAEYRKAYNHAAAELGKAQEELEAVKAERDNQYEFNAGQIAKYAALEADHAESVTALCFVRSRLIGLRHEACNDELHELSEELTGILSFIDAAISATTAQPEATCKDSLQVQPPVVAESATTQTDQPEATDKESLTVQPPAEPSGNTGEFKCATCRDTKQVPFVYGQEYDCVMSTTVPCPDCSAVPPASDETTGCADDALPLAMVNAIEGWLNEKYGCIVHGVKSCPRCSVADAHFIAANPRQENLNKLAANIAAAKSAAQPATEQPRIWRVRNAQGILYGTGTCDEAEARKWAAELALQTLAYSTDNGKTWIDEQAEREGKES